MAMIQPMGGREGHSLGLTDTRCRGRLRDLRPPFTCGAASQRLRSANLSGPPSPHPQNLASGEERVPRARQGIGSHVHAEQPELCTGLPWSPSYLSPAGLL